MESDVVGMIQGGDQGLVSCRCLIHVARDFQCGPRSADLSAWQESMSIRWEG